MKDFYLQNEQIILSTTTVLAYNIMKKPYVDLYNCCVQIVDLVSVKIEEFLLIQRIIRHWIPSNLLIFLLFQTSGVQLPDSQPNY